MDFAPSVVVAATTCHCTAVNWPQTQPSSCFCDSLPTPVCTRNVTHHHTHMRKLHGVCLAGPKAKQTEVHHNNAATPCMGPSLRHAQANLCKLEIRPRLVCSLLSAKCWQNKCSLGTENPFRSKDAAVKKVADPDICQLP
jgi:hypothetical protein